MAKDQIIIEFKARGDKAVTQAIRELDNATRSLRGQSKKWQNTSATSVKHNRLLDNSFATLRSRLLLVNFAMAMGVRQIISFAKESTKVESMSRAFTTLSGGTENAGVAMKRLREATNGTMSQFDLFQQANNAMILGVSKNSEEMAEMFDMAQRLGNALGKDTKLSVESLVTGIGRQSRLMLDNIGIIVKSDEAYSDYAKKLGISKDNLTDAEKKQAFLNATLESARKKVANLPPELITAQMSFDAFGASIDDAQVRLGEALTPLLKVTAELLTDLIDAIDVDMMQRWGLAVGATAVAFGIYKTAVRLAKIETVSFSVMLAKTGWGTAIVAAGLLAGTIMELTGAFEDSSDETEVFTENMVKFGQVEGQFNRQIQLSIDKINQRKKAMGNMVMTTKEMRDQTFELNKLEREKLQIDAGVNDTIRQQTQIRLEQQHISRLRFDDLLTEEEAKIALLQLEIKLNDINEKHNKTLEKQKKLRQDILATTLEQGFASRKTTSIAIAAAQKELVEYIKVAMAKQFEKAIKFIPLPPPFNVAIAAGFAAAAGSAIRNLIDSFETGGLVGGRRHSQGGTIIEAEQGEFVMSRNAVESIGIENLNRMNQGGGGAITVNVSGNVLSQDFVEGELAENIKEAVRRGTDFGIS